MQEKVLKQVFSATFEDHRSIYVTDEMHSGDSPVYCRLWAQQCLKLFVLVAGICAYLLSWLSRNLRDSHGLSAAVPGIGRLYYNCIVGSRWEPDTSINTSTLLLVVKWISCLCQYLTNGGFCSRNTTSGLLSSQIHALQIHFLHPSHQIQLFRVWCSINNRWDQWVWSMSLELFWKSRSLWKWKQTIQKLLAKQMKILSNSIPH